MFQGKEPVLQMTETVTIATSADDTRSLGRELGAELHPGDVVHLHGPLGAGKSVFARGIGQALNAPHWRGSPTFNLVHEYDTRPRLYHLDLYRLGEDEVEDLHLEDDADTGVLVVEWADRAPSVLAHLGARHIEVHLTVLGPDEREIIIRRPA